MRDRPIVITEADLRRLREEVRVARSSWTTYSPLVESLDARLRRAQVVAASEAPKHTITMNSRFRVRDLRSEEAATWTLVYPLEADRRERRVSVLSPLGLAALGSQVGDFLWWAEDGHSHSGRIEALAYQPEAVGAHHL